MQKVASNLGKKTENIIVKINVLIQHDPFFIVSKEQDIYPNSKKKFTAFLTSCHLMVEEKYSKIYIMK